MSTADAKRSHSPEAIVGKTWRPEAMVTPTEKSTSPTPNLELPADRATMRLVSPN